MEVGAGTRPHHPQTAEAAALKWRLGQTTFGPNADAPSEHPALYHPLKPSAIGRRGRKSPQGPPRWAKPFWIWPGVFRPSGHEQRSDCIPIPNPKHIGSPKSRAAGGPSAGRLGAEPPPQKGKDKKSNSGRAVPGSTGTNGYDQWRKRRRNSNARLSLWQQISTVGRWLSGMRLHRNPGPAVGPEGPSGEVGGEGLGPTKGGGGHSTAHPPSSDSGHLGPPKRGRKQKRYITPAVSGSPTWRGIEVDT